MGTWLYKTCAVTSWACQNTMGICKHTDYGVKNTDG